jgi:hypothetical protein
MQMDHKDPEAGKKAGSPRGGIRIPVPVLLALLVVLDFALGEHVSAAPLFVCLVIWVAWTQGFGRAAAMGIFLSAAHFVRNRTYGLAPPVSPQILNGVILGATLVVLAFFTSRAAWRFRAMHSRILALERNLTICGNCGLIRLPDGSWVPVEASGQAAGQQGIMCPECERRTYEI